MPFPDSRRLHPQRPRALNALQRKLHTWELHHLRQVVADQQAQIEALQRDLCHAEDSAERWREDALYAIEFTGAAPGLTQSGHLVAVHVGAPS